MFDLTQTLQFETESNMLARNDEVEAEVRAEDQQKINEFGRLNTQKGEYQLDVVIANKAMSQLEAAEEEIMLSDVSFQSVLLNIFCYRTIFFNEGCSLSK